MNNFVSVFLRFLQNIVLKTCFEIVQLLKILFRPFTTDPPIFQGRGKLIEKLEDQRIDKLSSKDP